MAKSSQIYVRVDDEMDEAVEKYRKDRNLSDQSKAARKLMEIGLREQQNPLMYRFKNELVTYIGFMGVFAVITVIAGAVTEMIRIATAVKFAFVLVITAVVILALFESIRFIMGVNEVGVRVRELIQRVKA